MASQDRVPDAWDDDYEAIADAKSKTAQPPRISRAERKAQHEQANKQLWESAENPDMFHLPQNRGIAAPTAEFKPALKVLSRKPQPTTAKPVDIAHGVQGMNLQEEDDSEEEERKARAQSLAERQAKAAKEREEKQRKYAEVRERLFGSPDPASDGRSSPSKGQQHQAGRSRQKGPNRTKVEGRSQQSSSSADQSPARTPASHRQLYDPNELATGAATRPAYMVVDRRSSPAQEVPVRSPRGPDGSGRGGFGFAPRGNKSGGS